MKDMSKSLSGPSKHNVPSKEGLQEWSNFLLLLAVSGDAKVGPGQGNPDEVVAIGSGLFQTFVGHVDGLSWSQTTKFDVSAFCEETLTTCYNVKMGVFVSSNSVGHSNQDRLPIAMRSAALRFSCSLSSWKFFKSLW